MTLAFAILLAAGLAVSYLGKSLKLPSVTGYILAGLLLGPSGLGLISEDLAGQRLNHFTEIALMLIAFGIGEHLEIKKLRKSAQIVGVTGFCESGLAFTLGRSSFGRLS